MKVLVATDGSEHSMKAIQRALVMAETEGAAVTLMAVAHYGEGIYDEMIFSLRDKLDAAAKANLDQGKAMFDAKNLKVELVLEAGLTPANNIIRRAEDDKFDRIILGSTGATGFKKLLMGSTAAKVVANAPCEVTIVR